MKQRLASAALAALIAALPLGAAAYPTKPITMILGFAPGGPSDVMARVLTKKMEEFLKQPIVIENRARAPAAPSRAASSPVPRPTAIPSCWRPAASSRSM